MTKKPTNRRKLPRPKSTDTSGLELRKWCYEQALQALPDYDKTSGVDHILARAGKILDWVKSK